MGLAVKPLILTLPLLLFAAEVSAIGVNWGTQATHSLPPATVVQLLKDNVFQKVKLFDADSSILNALSNSGIQAMVGIPNDMLPALARSSQAAANWVATNVSSHKGVDIRYVAVGNEPFLETFNGSYTGLTLPALQNIQAALVNAGLGTRVKVTVPLDADVYQSPDNLPSNGDFRSDIKDTMLQIVEFLSNNSAPITVNIYPFISLYDDPNFPVEFAFFDGASTPINDNGRVYTNVFDASYDMLVWTLQKNGYGNMSIIVGEIGWPSDGDRNANLNYSRRFNEGFMSRELAGTGTPMRSGAVDAYLFSLIDEDGKSIQPGNFERHWGLFYFDGQPKYQLNLGTSSNGLIAAKGVEYLPNKWCIMLPSASLDGPEVAPSVSYACANADCTSLGHGTSCGNLDARGNISYAFNDYYQINNQLDSACKFPNVSIVTNQDPSTGTCKFKVMIKTATTSPGGTSGTSRSLRKPVGPMLVLMFAVLYGIMSI